MPQDVATAGGSKDGKCAEQARRNRALKSHSSLLYPQCRLEKIDKIYIESKRLSYYGNISASGPQIPPSPRNQNAAVLSIIPNLLVFVCVIMENIRST